MKLIFLLLFCIGSCIEIDAQIVFNPFFQKYPLWTEQLELEAQTNPLAQQVVSFHYMEGNGINQDYSKAIYWFQQYIKGNNPNKPLVYSYLGECFEHGKEDYEQAFSCYRLAALGKAPSAYFNLAACYLLGKGTTENVDSALFWFEKGILSPNRRASKVYCGYIYSFYKNDMEKGMKYLNEAAQEGSGMALYYLGEIYDDGIGGIKKDPSKAVLYYKESIYNETYAIVLRKLADHYFEGNGVPKDIEKAIEMYKDAARMGDETAKHKLTEIQH